MDWSRTGHLSESQAINTLTIQHKVTILPGQKLSNRNDFSPEYLASRRQRNEADGKKTEDLRTVQTVQSKRTV